MGIECIIPVARWKGFGGITDPSGYTLETITWACGLLALTRPDSVARELTRLHAAGFDGAAIDFVNYLGELPYFAQEVIPRLERAGIRKPVS